VHEARLLREPVEGGVGLRGLDGCDVDVGADGAARATFDCDEREHARAGAEVEQAAARRLAVVRFDGARREPGGGVVARRRTPGGLIENELLGARERRRGDAGRRQTSRRVS